MDERIRIVFEKGKPIVRLSDDNVKVVITFEEEEKTGVKESIVDILTNSYKDRVIA